MSTEPAHIEAVHSRYSDLIPLPANLGQGVAHWDPPPAALGQMETVLQESTNHKYGPALGEHSLRGALVKKLERENGLNLTGQEVMACSPFRIILRRTSPTLKLVGLATSCCLVFCIISIFVVAPSS